MIEEITVGRVSNRAKTTTSQAEFVENTVFTVTACFFPGLRGRQKDCSTNLMLRTPMCTRPRLQPIKCEWKRGDQFSHGME
jgi:hypothetical protein